MTSREEEPTRPGGDDDAPEPLLTRLLDTIDEGFVVFDDALRFVRMNNSAESFFRQFMSASRADLIGRSMWDAFPRLRGSALAEHFLGAMSAEHAEFEVRSPASERWVSFRTSRGVGELVVLFRDTTRERTAIDALRASETRMRSLFENSFEGILLTAPSGEVYAANPAACRMFGREEAEICRLGRASIVDPADPRLGAMLEARARDGHVSGEITMLRADGTRFPALVTSAVFLDEDGRARTSMAIVDLSERARSDAEKRALQAQLALADRMAALGTLASGIAHEINNPLAYVMLNLATIESRLRAAPGAGGEARGDLRELAAEAMSGAERVREIVRGLKTLGRADVEHRAPLEVNATVEVAIDMASHAVRHRARLVRDFGPASFVEADEPRLVQAFINLLVNAAQAMPEGRPDRNEIRVRTGSDADGRVVVEVSDTGRGIPEGLLSRVFDPFFTTQDVGAGTGLGLSISHSIVAGLGGAVTVASEVGRGTTFKIVLPACAPGPRGGDGRAL